jgi:hypothetical protein
MASTIMGPTIYAGTILLYLSVRRQLDRKGVACDSKVWGSGSQGKHEECCRIGLLIRVRSPKR